MKGGGRGSDDSDDGGTCGDGVRIDDDDDDGDDDSDGDADFTFDVGDERGAADSCFTAAPLPLG